MNTSNSKAPLLIGISGTFSSGKDKYAEHLKGQYGYRHVSTGDIVREKAMHERGSVERPVLHDVATKWRHEKGAGIFAELALDGPLPAVITGIRSLGEARKIKEHCGVMVFIDAPFEIRYERMIKRARDKEIEVTLEEFKQREQSEWYSGDSDADFNMRDIKKMADIVLDEDLGLAEFYQVLDQRLGLA